MSGQYRNKEKTLSRDTKKAHNRHKYNTIFRGTENLGGLASVDTCLFKFICMPYDYMFKKMYEPISRTDKYLINS